MGRFLSLPPLKLLVLSINIANIIITYPLEPKVSAIKTKLKLCGVFPFVERRQVVYFSLNNFSNPVLWKQLSLGKVGVLSLNQPNFRLPQTGAPWLSKLVFSVSCRRATSWKSWKYQLFHMEIGHEQHILGACLFKKSHELGNQVPGCQLTVSMSAGWPKHWATNCLETRHLLAERTFNLPFRKGYLQTWVQIHFPCEYRNFVIEIK